MPGAEKGCFTRLLERGSRWRKNNLRSFSPGSASAVWSPGRDWWAQAALNKARAAEARANRVQVALRPAEAERNRVQLAPPAAEAERNRVPVAPLKKSRSPRKRSRKKNPDRAAEAAQRNSAGGTKQKNHGEQGREFSVRITRD